MADIDNIRMADEALEIVSAAIAGRAVCIKWGDLAAQLLWFADELRRTADEIEALITEEGD
ncbi:MAG: hypothetical protein GX601_10265 [Anaerolineales bacterium]|nr:hypothetical protein [Anaerolineales bacterium]